MNISFKANRTNQCNPLHTRSGPGHKSGYSGTGTVADLNNHSNQMNVVDTTRYGRIELIFPTYKHVTLVAPSGGKDITFTEKL